MAAPPRPEPAFAGYDEATLLAAQWVARAAPGLRPALPAPTSTHEDTARYYRHYGLPGHRAAMRALLDDTQAYADRAPKHAAGCLKPAGEEGGEVVWLRVEVEPGDRLLAVRRHRATHVVVVRTGRVAAVICGQAVVGGTAGEPDALPRGWPRGPGPLRGDGASAPVPAASPARSSARAARRHS